MDSDKRKLLINTGFLYLLTFSSFVFGVITLPYQTRVLGPEMFGVIGFAAAFQQYFSIIIDFGFILSATKHVTENRLNKDYLGRILSSVTLAKILLGVIVLIFTFIIALFVPKILRYFGVIFCYWLLSVFTSLTPDFIYRGLENMKVVTYIALIVRFVFTLLIFVFLKKPDDYLMVPIFYTIGVVVSLIFIYWDLSRKQQISFLPVHFNEVLYALKDSSQYFLSRIAATVYGATNALIIGLIYPTTTMLGYYSSADKFKQMASQAGSPIADSLYPYMLRTKDYRSLYRIVGVIELFVIVGCLFLGLYSEEICILVFGDEYGYVGHVLLFLLPCIALIMPNYVFGFPALTPIGQQKWANYSVELAMVVQLLGIFVLWIIGELGIISLCCLTCLSELVVFVIRITVFFKHKNDCH